MENYSKDKLINSLSNLFDTHLSDPGRKALVGKKIDDILSKYFDRISSIQLASALLSKYGVDLFNPRYKILESIINRLKREEANELANYLGIKTSSDIYETLILEANKKSNLPLLLEYFEQPTYYLTPRPKDKRIATGEISIEYDDDIKSLGYPHPYQNSVKLKALERMTKASGKVSFLIVMPTGSGKTRTAIEIMIDFIRIRRMSTVLWLVEKPELAEQALSSFEKLWQLRGDRSVLFHRSYNKFNPEVNIDHNTNVIFAGFDKLTSYKKKDAKIYNVLKSNIDLLIVDEAHYSLAETYEHIISDLEKKNNNLIKIGLTATPMRPDDNDFFNLKTFFNSHLIEFEDEKNLKIDDPIKYLQNKRYLAKIKTEFLSLPEEFIDEKSKDFNDAVVNRLKFCQKDREKVIVFARSKDHAIALDILLKYHALKSECIIGETTNEERQSFFERFSNGDLMILVNYDILSTGIDLPKVDTLFLLRKFGQYTTAMQVLGRALRGHYNGGNDHNKIISIKGNHDFINEPSDLYNTIKNMY
ncbi:Superfamily II DNA or RNA helicase [Salinimicrobium sediminis]|uniref:Superfamily II DNA or RNA helicase n=1 Tax=Salinimicrobium sediminis TaxID=1343891 RepID=A0A285X9V5_9FLAO|nr:DEAD/DEAH box helicase family protein [Salinimicrobium sediminis]SOC81564.1 Superfamily II DNA or RNA helicase [Salinimicrobium sediminis]